jgi:hypothetical protein
MITIKDDQSFEKLLSIGNVRVMIDHGPGQKSRQWEILGQKNSKTSILKLPLL